LRDCEKETCGWVGQLCRSRESLKERFSACTHNDLYRGAEKRKDRSLHCGRICRRKRRETEENVRRLQEKGKGEWKEFWSFFGSVISYAPQKCNTVKTKSSVGKRYHTVFIKNREEERQLNNGNWDASRARE